MAIEQTLMDAQFQSISDMELRNAPTPPLPYIKDEQIDLDSFNFNYAGNFDISEFNPDLALNQTITFGQFASSNHQMYPDHTNTNSSFTDSNQQYLSAYPTQAHFIDDDASGRDSVVSKISRKGKCMSRNAIAARENREKKKNEMTTLRSKVAMLEQETATYKKKYNDIKEVYKRSHEQNQYYESLLKNLPSIMSIIDHMKAVPKDDNSKKLKKKLNSMNFPNNNLGICFHVKASQDMSLKFCESCSNGSSSGTKKKNVET